MGAEQALLLSSSPGLTPSADDDSVKPTDDTRTGGAVAVSEYRLNDTRVYTG
jgi:hypothetical protein